MRHITLANLLLALDDLLTKRLPALQAFEAGKASQAFFAGKRAKIAALPAELTGRPHADALATTDAQHDGFGAALWFMTEAYLRSPTSTPAQIEAARKIRAAFVSTLDTLNARYEAEAKAAKEHEPSLVALKSELLMFPVAGGTMLDWAAGLITAGKKLDELLSKRADTKDRKEARALRGDTLARLNRLREDLADARADDPTLPADLEAQVFGYLDLLEKNDAAVFAEEKKKAAAKKAPAPEGSGGAP